MTIFQNDVKGDIFPSSSSSHAVLAPRTLVLVAASNLESTKIGLHSINVSVLIILHRAVQHSDRFECPQFSFQTQQPHVSLYYQRTPEK